MNTYRDSYILRVVQSRTGSRLVRNPDVGTTLRRSSSTYRIRLSRSIYDAIAQIQPNISNNSDIRSRLGCSTLLEPWTNKHDPIEMLGRLALGTFQCVQFLTE